MKNRIVAAVLAFMLLLPVLSGCTQLSNSSNGNASGEPELKYRIELLGYGYASWMSANDNNFMMGVSYPDVEIEVLDKELNLINRIEHENFAEGSHMNDGFHLAPDNGYWLTEVTRPAAPNLGQNGYLRLFDNEGQEVFTIDMQEEYGVNLILIGCDSQGNAYLYNDYSGFGREPICLYVIDQTGQLVLQTDKQFYIALRMTTTVEGRVILMDLDVRRNLYELIDYDIVPLHTFDKNEAYNYLYGGKDNCIYLPLFEDLYCFNLDTFEMQHVANWPEFTGSSLDYLKMMTDGEIYIGVRGRLARLVENDGQEVEDNRTVIKIASYTLSSEHLRWITEFNETSSEYVLEAMAYQQYDTDDNIYGAAFRLNLDIIAGKAPDIYLWSFAGGFSGFNCESYAGRGLFADISEFLDRDEELSRESFLPNMIEALETENGELSELPIEFVAYAWACRASDISLEQWTLREFFDEHSKRPEAIAAFGVAPEYFLVEAFNCNSEEFVDWNAGTCNFETEYFIELLNFVKSQKIDPSKAYFGLPSNNIAAGKQYLYATPLGMVADIQRFKQHFQNDEVKFIGFPTTEGRGNSFRFMKSISISSSSVHKDVCWEIIRHFYTSEYQLSKIALFPTNIIALEYNLMNPNAHYEGDRIQVSNAPPDEEFVMVITEVTEEEAKQVRELVYSLDSVYRQNNFIAEILLDSTQRFLNGQGTAEDAARVIQNRVSIYLAEQH